VLSCMKSCDGGGVLTSIALAVGSWGDELRGVWMFLRGRKGPRGGNERGRDYGSFDRV
jgi:hypothetical protein